MPPPQKITAPKLLVVEGRDAEVFLSALLQTIGLAGIQVQGFMKEEASRLADALRGLPNLLAWLDALQTPTDIESDQLAACQSVCNALLAHATTSDIQIQDFGGIGDMRHFLTALTGTAAFQQNMVKSLGIIRDAEDNATGAFQSVRSALAAARLPVPSAPNQPAGENPRVSVFILPDNKEPGMLETLCLAAVTDDPVMPCVETYLECVRQYAAAPPQNLPKAKAQAFLASRERPGLRLGEAAHGGCWPWDAPTFAPMKQFLQAL